MLRRETLDAQFAGMKQALENPDPAAMQAVKDMLADLNSLLAAHARQEDTTDQFADFMAKHGEFFPENPENVDELIDALARQQAAAQRMMASLSPRAARAAGPADEPGPGRRRPGLGDGSARGQPARAATRDGPRSPVQMRGNGPSLGYGEAVEAVAEIADLEALQAQLSQNYAGSTLDDVDVELVERRLGRSAAQELEGAPRAGARAGAAGLSAARPTTGSGSPPEPYAGWARPR